MIVGLLGVVAFFAVIGLASWAVIRADRRDQAAYDRWFDDFMRRI